MSENTTDDLVFALEHYRDFCDGVVPHHRFNEMIAALRTQADEIAGYRESLAAISRDGCEKFTSGGCADHPNLSPVADYSADRWCMPCIARAALSQEAKG